MEEPAGQQLSHALPPAVLQFNHLHNLDNLLYLYQHNLPKIKLLYINLLALQTLSNSDDDMNNKKQWCYQESFAPAPRPPLPRTTPYSQRGLQDEEDAEHTFDVDVNNKTKFPHGWKNANGHLILDDTVMGSWELAATPKSQWRTG